MAGVIGTLALAAAMAHAGPVGPESPLGAGPASPVEFRVRAEPRVLLPGQSLSLLAVWRNPAPAGGPAVRVNRRGLLGYDVVVTIQAKGKAPLALVTPADLGPPADRDFQQLGPGEYFEYEYPVTLKSPGPIPPGSYDVKVVYRNETPGPGVSPAWMGRLEAKVKVKALKAPKKALQ